ncbi:hypothetical protein ACVBEF_03610 [Glaciimonas sp. GG7]
MKSDALLELSPLPTINTVTAPTRESTANVALTNPALNVRRFILDASFNLLLATQACALIAVSDALFGKDKSPSNYLPRVSGKASTATTTRE